MLPCWLRKPDSAVSCRLSAATDIKLYEKYNIYDSYRDYEFSITHFDTDCKTYYGIDDSGRVIFITYKRETNLIYILIRSDTGSEHLVASTPRRLSILGIFRSVPSVKAVLRSLSHPLSSLNLKQFKDKSVLRDMDLRLSFKKFRFGVVMVGQEDIDEEDALMNEEPSEDFNGFVQNLGERIALKGWLHYAGGLDTRNDYTGTDSVYHRTSRNDEVMFQIAQWIPCQSVVDRKRLIGNNVLNILFPQRNDWEFKLNSFVSKQTQCLVLVTKELTDYSCKIYRKQRDRYELREGSFHFTLDNGTFINFCTLNILRHVLTCLVINEELACYEAEPFRSLLVRTRQAMFKSLLS